MGLGPAMAGLGELRHEIEGPLRAHQAVLTQLGPDVELSLTIVATDLWTAVLLALAAVTSLGYPARWLDVRPAPPPPASRPPAPTDDE